MITVVGETSYIKMYDYIVYQKSIILNIYDINPPCKNTIVKILDFDLVYVKDGYFNTVVYSLILNKERNLTRNLCTVRYNNLYCSQIAHHWNFVEILKDFEFTHVSTQCTMNVCLIHFLSTHQIAYFV